MSDYSIEYLAFNQGTPEWHQERAGVITASMFGEVMKVVGGLTDQQQIYVDALLAGKSEAFAKEAAGYKSAPRTEKVEKALDGERVGDWSEAAKEYAFRTAIERISGESLDEGFETWAMRRGKELEPDARNLHAFQYGLDIEEVGFVRTTDRKFGASADGLIGEDGGSEYKCFVAPGKLRRILIDRDISEELVQCQGGLWLTGRKWWHFGLYCPALLKADRALTIIPVARDEEYIANLEARLVEFDELVESFRAELLEPATDLQEAA